MQAQVKIGQQETVPVKVHVKDETTGEIVEVVEYHTIEKTVVDVVPFELPPKTVEELKAEKTELAKAKFAEMVSAPVKVGKVTYNGGKESALAIRDYIQLVTESGGTEYKIWDTTNTISTYTLTEAEAIKLAIGTSVAQAEFYLRAKKNEIEACSTIDEITLVEV